MLEIRSEQERLASGHDTEPAADVHVDDPQAVEKLAVGLAENVPAHVRPVLLCIGSDLATGDSLGPMVGTLLRESGFSLPLYGTLDRPVHAVNLPEVAAEIREKHPDSIVIAIDAALGTTKEIGRLQLHRKALCPGGAVEKNLGQVGDLAITGVVNVGGVGLASIYTVRLRLVWRMARVVSRALLRWETGRSALCSVRETAIA